MGREKQVVSQMISYLSKSELSKKKRERTLIGRVAWLFSSVTGNVYI